MNNDVLIHNMAVVVFDALNKKGAGLGDAAIGIIEQAIEANLEGKSKSVPAPCGFCSDNFNPVYFCKHTLKTSA